MKKYFVIGNPISHSLSPKLHNFWFRKHNLNAKYEKLLLEKDNLNKIVQKVKTGEISGLNVTVPFKQLIIPFLEKLSPEAQNTQSVNTVYLENNKLVGHNTDIAGFELAIRHIKFDTSNKNVLILGAGGVVPSVISALKNLSTKKISLMNRTKEKAEKLKSIFNEIEIIDWGALIEFDMIINATSLGLKQNDKFGIDFSNVGQNKLFYDVIYEPFQTEFSKAANLPNNKFENGLNMFVYQAQKAFSIWHNIEPTVNEELIKFLRD